MLSDITNIHLRGGIASDAYFQDDISDPEQCIPAIWAGSHGLIYMALQAALKLSRFNIVTCVERTGDVDAAAVLLPPRLLLIINVSRTAELLADAAEIERLRKAYPKAIIAVILGGHFTPTDIVSLSAANVVISQNASANQLRNVLDIAVDGVAILPMTLPPTMVHLDRDSPQPAISVAGTGSQGLTLQRPLSNREAAILQQLSVGQSNKAIARVLSITEDTVKAHIKGILRKLCAVNRTQAAVWALTNLKPPEHQS